jgi:hypothetical protein
MFVILQKYKPPPTERLMCVIGLYFYLPYIRGERRLTNSKERDFGRVPSGRAIRSKPARREKRLHCLSTAIPHATFVPKGWGIYNDKKIELNSC